jgi:hypothetical protein
MELSARHLRDYLKRLPAFEDMPAEEKALDLVADHDDLEEALWFLLHWPEPHRAARLVLAAPKPLNGDRYYLLAPLAELLEKRQPLAAKVCLRAMINFTLKVARSKRYPHAGRHLETCHRLADAINDWGSWLITAVIWSSCGGITTASVAFGVRCLRRLFLRLRW